MEKFTQDQVDHIKSVKVKLSSALRAKLLDPMITNEMHDLILHNCVLSGGATASVILKEKINDFDLYFKNKEAMDKFKKLLEFKGNQAMVKDAEVKYGGHKLITIHATTLFNDLQVITMMLSEDRNKNFDFVHCRPYYDIDEDKFYISFKEYECILNKKLIVNSPESLTDKRIAKFKERGWTL